MYKLYSQFSAHVNSTAHRLHLHHAPLVFLVVHKGAVSSFRASLERSNRQWPPCPITSLFGRGMGLSQRPTLWLKGCRRRTTQHTTCDQVGFSTMLSGQRGHYILASSSIMWKPMCAYLYLSQCIVLVLFCGVFLLNNGVLYTLWEIEEGILSVSHMVDFFSKEKHFSPKGPSFVGY